jgi:cytochrome c556
MRAWRNRIRNDHFANLMAATFVILGAASPALGQEAPGLTGATHPDDAIFARQLVMDEMETRAPGFDAAGAGDEFDMEALKEDAYLMSTLFSAFAHLFPPETRPTVSPDGSPPLTAATDAVWQDFETFYGQVNDAAALALDMSLTDDTDQFREQAKQLRAACDSCHATYMFVVEPGAP